MPLFEFICHDCKEPFEELVRSADAVADVACPVCGGSQVSKKVSRIAARVAASSGLSLGASSAAACSTGSL